MVLYGFIQFLTVLYNFLRFSTFSYISFFHSGSWPNCAHRPNNNAYLWLAEDAAARLHQDPRLVQHLYTHALFVLGLTSRGTSRNQENNGINSKGLKAVHEQLPWYGAYRISRQIKREILQINDFALSDSEWAPFALSLASSMVVVLLSCLSSGDVRPARSATSRPSTPP